LRALCQQLDLLSRMNMDLKDDVKWIKKQNIGADRRGNTIRKAVPHTRSDFDVFVDENADVCEEDYDGDVESGSDKSYCEGKPPLKDSEGDELALPVAASLVMRSTLHVQVKEDESNEPKENALLSTKQGVWFDY
jgi:hypothetical protein